jgi:histidinol-phosphate aminotransferase
MKRRAFLRSGFAIGAAAGLGGGTAVLPDLASALTTRSDGTLRLNSNENALGLSPAARSAIIDGLADANRYPRDNRVRMIETLAEAHGAQPENIVLGCGSTEILQMSVQALFEPGATLVLADPTFEDVPSYAEPFPYEVVKVPLDGRYSHDIGRMREVVEAARGRSLVYLCNPNNPTGTLTPSAEIDAWIESAPENVYFLADEAYFEYCEDPGFWSCTKYIDRPNVIVARTFSKIYAMAGIRLGYAVAHVEAADMLRQFIAKTNANELVLVAAYAALHDDELVPRSLAANTEAKAILYECLDELDLEHLPSHTNFVMHRINGDLDTYRQRMLENDVKVGRNFPPMLSYNRLSIGLPEEMARFTEILRGFRDKSWV